MQETTAKAARERRACHSWQQQMARDMAAKQALIVRIKLRLARYRLEGRPCEGLELMLRELEGA